MLPGDITITKQMADAINKYAGQEQEIVTKDMVGRTFLVGSEGDGEIEIDISSQDRPCGINLRAFIEFDGFVKDVCFRFPAYHFEYDWDTGLSKFVPDVDTCCKSNDDPCCGREVLITSFPQEKAIVIIGALYGFGELPKVVDISQKMETEALNLRKAMGL